MPTPAFGFSVGDFVAGIKLVKDLIESLDEAAGAKPAYQRLIAELHSLDRALTEVKSLRVHPSQACHKIALEQAAAQCHDCIETFLRTNQKFESTLGLQVAASTLRTNLHKFKWAACKKDAVDKFRAEIAGHVLTINTLISTMQLASTTLQTENMERQHDAATKHYQEESEARCLVKRNNDILNTQAELLLTISRTVATCATQQNTQNLQQIVLDVLSTNMKIYEIVLDMQMTMHGRLPPQIHRQQPVYFEDAHGRIAPFHIEFINFLEAFQAVMEVRFRHVPGLKKVQRNEYIIQESGSRRKLDLRAHWDSVFLPGRKVVMSMVFHTPQESSSTCPGCQTHNTSTNTESQREAQCCNPDCRMWYQRVSHVGENATQSVANFKFGNRMGASDYHMGPRKTRIRQSFDDQPTDENGDNHTISLFRRVQVVHIKQKDRHITENEENVVVESCDSNSEASEVKITRGHVELTLHKKFIGLSFSKHEKQMSMTKRSRIKSFRLLASDALKVEKSESEMLRLHRVLQRSLENLDARPSIWRWHNEDSTFGVLLKLEDAILAHQRLLESLVGKRGARLSVFPEMPRHDDCY